MTDAHTPPPADPRAHPEQIVRSLSAEFAGTFNRETIARFVDDSLARFAGARAPTFVSVLAERFAGERLRALAKVEGKSGTDVPMVLFLCVHNAGRSQMAAAFLRHLARERVGVYSAGSEPASEINRAVHDAMAEVGIDLSREYPKPWTDEIVAAADLVVTMGCGDACPILPGKRYVDWPVADPAGLDVRAVRPIRDDIERRVRALLAELGLPAGA